MKPVVPFLVGAVLATAVVFMVMHDRAPEQQTSAVVQTTAEPVAEVPLDTPPSVDSTAPSTPPERASQGRAWRPSAMPSRRDQPRRETPTPQAANTPASQPQQQPQQQPAQAPQNQPPAYQTGPVVPASPAQIPPMNAEARPERKPEPRKARTVTIPAGTLLTVRVNETLSTRRNQTGDSFSATLDQPVVVDGFVIAERGSKVEGRVAESDPGGRVKGVSHIALELVRLSTSDGQRVRLQTESFAKEGQKDTKRDVAKIGAAAGIGAAIGAIAGGGKGAAIGAAAGGAAGTGGVMATRGAPAELPAETRVSFRLREPITITEKIN